MRGETPNMEPLPDRGLKERGKQAFERYQCGQCHSRVEEASSSGATPALPYPSQASEGCLATEPQAHLPRYDFSAEMRSEMQSLLSEHKKQISSNHFRSTTSCATSNVISAILEKALASPLLPPWAISPARARILETKDACPLISRVSAANSGRKHSKRSCWDKGPFDPTSTPACRTGDPGLPPSQLPTGTRKTPTRPSSQPRTMEAKTQSDATCGDAL